MAQQLLTALTLKKDVRAPIEGRTVEDPSLFRRDKEIGFTPAPDVQWYKTILEAMYFDWKLLGPPQWSEEEKGWDWWLVREVK